jgi:hypothetical protein
MKRWLFLPLLGCVACDAPLCREQDSWSGAPIRPFDNGVVSEARTGSARLVNTGDELSASFVLRVSELPEVWEPRGALLDGRAELRVGLRYEAEPFGGDGKTQMPVVEIGLVLDQETDASRATATPPFPLKPAGGTSRVVFPICNASQMTSCCERGSRECAHALRVHIERLDGPVFAPVVADFTLSASARVSDCPPNGDPVMELEEVEP